MKSTEASAVNHFTEIADRFCAFLEQESLPGKAEFLLQATIILVELYQVVLTLPDTQPSNRDTLPDVEVSYEYCRTIGGRIAEVVGEHDLYWEVFNPHEADEPVATTINDDLTDIYRDLKYGLLVFHGSESAAPNVNEAAWHWRFSFTSHWGYHMVDALRALHWAMNFD